MFSGTSSDRPRSKNEAERQKNIRESSDMNSEYNNPCIKELRLAYKCLDDNNYDREKCLNYFANYKTCRDFWDRVKADRTNRGIKPYLPWPEERAVIKEEYMKKFKLKS